MSYLLFLFLAFITAIRLIKTLRRDPCRLLTPCRIDPEFPFRFKFPRASEVTPILTLAFVLFAFEQELFLFSSPSLDGVLAFMLSRGIILECSEFSLANWVLDAKTR